MNYHCYLNKFLYVAFLKFNGILLLPGFNAKA